MSSRTMNTGHKALRLFLITGLFIFGMVVILAMAGSETRADWTMLVYLDGNNNLENYSIDDFDEIENSAAPDVDVLVLHDLNDTSGDDTTLYRVNDGTTTHPTPGWLDDEENMGDHSTLEDFITWGLDNYPSDHTFLVLWDHGGAWKGCCEEEATGDILRMREIRYALDNSLGGDKFDIIGFMACSMASTEVCYELRDYAEYVVASEKTAWLYGGDGYNWDMDTIIDLMDTTGSATTICREIVDNAMDLKVGMKSESHTWSYMDIDDVDDLATAMDDFCDRLTYYFPTYYMDIIQARMDSEEYKTGKRIDLFHFVENINNNTSLPSLLRSSARDLMDAINDTVVYERHRSAGSSRGSGGSEGNKGNDTSNGNDREQRMGGEKEETLCDHAHGLNIFFPHNRTAWDSRYTGNSGPMEFANNTQWDDWLEFYLSYIFVDDDYSGDEVGSLEQPYNTIQEALDEADNGDVIRVFEGTYDENIEINNEIQIIGNGTDTEIQPTSGDAVKIWDNDVTMSLFYVASPTGDTAVHVNNDAFTIYDCTLSTSGEYCLYLSNADDSIVRDCIIENADMSGIYVTSTNDLLLYDNDISDCTENGIFLYQSDRAVIHDNAIHDNTLHGIEVDNSDDSQIYDCDIYSNTDHGVFNDGSPLVDARFNYWGSITGPSGKGPGGGDKINENVQYSPWLGYWVITDPQTFYVDDTGQIQDAIDHADAGDNVLVKYGIYVENVHVHKTLYLAGDVDIPPYPVIYANEFGDAVYITAMNVEMERFYIYTGPGGDNDIHIGSDTLQGDHATIRDCNLSTSGGDALYFHYSANNCYISDCSIEEAGDNGIRMNDAPDPSSSYNTIENCRINNSAANGVYLERYCYANVFKGCTIYENGESGILNQAMNTEITFSTIQNNPKDGVSVSQGSNTLIKWCDIMDNGNYGVMEDSGATNTDARFCFWGDASGPGGDGPGHGDEISAAVLYSPWLGYEQGTSPQWFYVDETGSIQLAVDHSSDGDTIRVWAGTFKENVVVNKRLDLIGNGSAAMSGDNTVISADNTGDALYIESNWANITLFYIMTGTGENDVDIRADHVTIDNCTLTTSGDECLYMRNADFCTIDQCTIENSGSHGIWLFGFKIKAITDSDNNTISNCNINNNTEDGIYIHDYCDNNTIIDCIIENNGGNGVSVYGDDNSIMSCDINDNGGTGIYVNGSMFNYIEACLLLQNLDDGIHIYNSTEITIANCAVRNNLDDGICFTMADLCLIMESNISGNTDQGMYFSSSRNNTIEKCTINSNGDAFYGFGAHDNSFTDCNVHKNGYGFFFFFSSRNVIRKCNIQDNSDVGVNAGLGSYDTDARYNYWGDKTGPGGFGPGNGDEISLSVLYSPWYGNTVGSIPQIICLDSTGKLQGALDWAKKGDTIRVFAGTYFGNLKIEKAVNLIGNGSEETIIRGKQKGDIIRIMENANWLNMTGFRIVGTFCNCRSENDAGTRDGTVGIDDPVGEDPLEIGIRIKAKKVTLVDVMVVDTQQGILLESAHETVIRDSLIRNNGRGITLGSSDQCRLMNNTIIGNRGPGIEIMKSSRNSILKNIITENPVGIIIKDNAMDNQIHENHIHKNKDFGIQVINNGENRVNATRNWWGKDFGPYHAEKNKGKEGEERGDNITDLVDFSPWLDEAGAERTLSDDIPDNGDGEKPEEEEENGDEFIPGFEMIMFVCAMAVALGISQIEKRRRNQES